MMVMMIMMMIMIEMMMIDMMIKMMMTMINDDDACYCDEYSIGNIDKNDSGNHHHYNYRSRTAKLYPRDSGKKVLSLSNYKRLYPCLSLSLRLIFRCIPVGDNYNFGQDVAIYNNLVAISGTNCKHIYVYSL